MVADAASWLRQAELDLEAAKYNHDGGHFQVAAFLAQQSAEKALKAVYVKEKDSLWRTHDVVAIAQELDAPAQVLDACELLAPHYVATRYPVAERDEYDEEVSDVALEAAAVIFDWVQVRL